MKTGIIKKQAVIKQKLPDFLMWDGQPFTDLLTIILGCKKASVHMVIKELNVNFVKKDKI